MNALLVAPLLLIVVGSLAGWFLPRLAGPATCVRVLAAATVAAAGGVTAALVLVTLAAASEVHSVSDLIGWCQALYPGDHGAAPWAGTVAFFALTHATTVAVRYARRTRRELASFGPVDGVQIVQAAGPVAFAVPGRPGGVIMGDQLLRSLDSNERRVVLAHEQAHLDLKHHRYVHAAEMCAAAFPFLLPIARQVRYNSERWADESAAQIVGSRELVAKVIAKVALLGSAAPSATLAFGCLGTVDRVHAMLNPRSSRIPELAAVASALTILITLAGSSVQVHHLATFVVHACS